MSPRRTTSWSSTRKTFTTRRPSVDVAETVDVLLTIRSAVRRSTQNSPRFVALRSLEDRRAR